MGKPKKRNHAAWVVICFLIIAFVAILFPYNVLDGKKLFNGIIHINDYDKLGTFVGGITAPFYLWLHLYYCT